MSMPWCTAMFHLTPETLPLAGYSLNMWRTGHVWRLTGKRLCGSRVTQRWCKKPKHVWAAAPYHQSPNVLFCYRFTLWASARLTHTRMMYIEHMVFGIWPRGFASEGPAMRERRAFAKTRHSSAGEPDCGHDIQLTNKLLFTPSQHTAINRGKGMNICVR